MEKFHWLQLIWLKNNWEIVTKRRNWVLCNNLPGDTNSLGVVIILTIII